jgi:ABC-type tungstate transport system permease subunit
MKTKRTTWFYKTKKDRMMKIYNIIAIQPKGVRYIVHAGQNKINASRLIKKLSQENPEIKYQIELELN